MTASHLPTGRDDHDQPSVFTPEGLVREARRQKRLADRCVPEVCVLDPDGDLADYALDHLGAAPDPHWPCYHSSLIVAPADPPNRPPVGIIRRAVGGPYAVLVAEQLFASGCRLLISVTSAGQLTPLAAPPYFVLLTEAVRDEGTSHHYLPSEPRIALHAGLDAALGQLPTREATVHRGAAWTTDAPFRETQSAINAAIDAGLAAVEMEAASLYAFAAARSHPVVCFAHVTNQMAEVEGDFDKGMHNGATATLDVIAATTERLRRTHAS